MFEAFQEDLDPPSPINIFRWCLIVGRSGDIQSQFIPQLLDW
jgi:hypothetical protein